MKHRLLNFIAACGILCTTGIALQAQSYRLESNIPFAFQVGETAFPAGHYVFTRNSPSTFQTMRNTDTQRSIYVAGGTPKAASSKQPRLVFNQYGSQYFLSELWTNTGAGMHLRPGPVEREVRQNSLEASLNVPLTVARR